MLLQLLLQTLLTLTHTLELFECGQTVRQLSVVEVERKQTAEHNHAQQKHPPAQDQSDPEQGERTATIPKTKNNQTLPPTTKSKRADCIRNTTDTGLGRRPYQYQQSNRYRPVAPLTWIRNSLLLRAPHF
uniref:Putative secreted protein n=1 Tax=Anopheles darlingi TaxID=43151 RepID=A0A2M4DDY9_ANODA